ncbi:cupin domain-containing protein [Chryseobacterium sp.]|uniref:cupin domain-containing protein n=1 Tax=Chryseobacterium sp. TaxID=1871047 RepID=UPI0031D30735
MISIASFYDELFYESGNKPAVKIMIKTHLAKEIRILFRKDQEMKKHTAPYPIVVQTLEGSINFGVEGEIHLLKKGMMISLPAHIPHNLIALEDSMIRLSLNLQDNDSRLKELMTINETLKS